MRQLLKVHVLSSRISFLLIGLLLSSNTSNNMKQLNETITFCLSSLINSKNLKYELDELAIFPNNK